MTSETRVVPDDLLHRAKTLLDVAAETGIDNKLDDGSESPNAGYCRKASDEIAKLLAAPSAPVVELQRALRIIETDHIAYPNIPNEVREVCGEAAAALTQARTEAIEECAKVCDDLEIENDINQSMSDAMGADDSAIYHKGSRIELAKAVAAIRSLKPQ